MLLRACRNSNPADRALGATHANVRAKNLQDLPYGHEPASESHSDVSRLRAPDPADDSADPQRGQLRNSR